MKFSKLSQNCIFMIKRRLLLYAVLGAGKKGNQK
jgi:hypothetical protein